MRALAFSINNFERRPGQIVTFGVSEAEPPGRSLPEAQLVMAVLDYVAQEDWGLVNRISPQALKWERIKRLCTQAYQQGVVLTMLDLEWLLGVNGAFVRQTLDAYHERFGMLLPTAGSILGMGRTLMHKTIVVKMSLSGRIDQLAVIFKLLQTRA
ncbi:MAG: DUF1670 domain-containing protein [Bacillota bacterium]